jgi:predicted Zn-ribbon and HTH transcriptional regulator
MAKGARDKEPEIGLVMLQGARCRCGHEWLPRGRDGNGKMERPTVCPKCKSPRWDKPKRGD